MKIHASRFAYDCGGYEPTFSLGAWFLSQHTREYGKVINEIWISVYFPPGGETRPTWGSLIDNFKEFLEGLPKVRVSRKKKSADIDAVTNVKPAHKRHFYIPSPQLFREGLRELERILTMLDGKIKKSDDFDLEAFLSDVRLAVSNAPKTTTEIERINESHTAHLRELNEKQDPWERLGIEWSEYHRNARKILSEPFYWEESNDYAPHGNDTGADVLTSYQDWRPSHRRANSLEFLSVLLMGWGVNISLAQGGDVANAKELIERDEFSINTYDDAIIGLAFACLKIDGKIKSEIVTVALQSISRQSESAILEHRGWRDQSQRTASLEKMTACLRKFV